MFYGLTWEQGRKQEKVLLAPGPKKAYQITKVSP